jgi:hypothetical protein
MKIFKKTIFIIILFSSLSVFAVEAKKEITDILFREYKQISFEKLPKSSVEELVTIIPNLEISSEYANEFDIMTDTEYFEGISNVYRLHDFTGDGIEDLIYNGYVGSEEMFFALWEKQNNKFRIAGITWGEIAKIFLESTNNKIYSFALISGLCCDGFVGDIKTFSPVFKAGNLTYMEKYSYRFFVWTSFPDEYEVISKKRFQIKTDSCSLRDSPETDNKYNKELSGFEDMPVYGNIIAKLAKGSTGTAYAKFQDELENLWWFVALDTNARATYKRFYRDTCAYKCGWIDTKFLDIIE